MDAATTNNNARINLRLKSNAKSIIERAAGFEGKTISHFILDSALKQAEKTVQAHEIMTLNEMDSQTFYDALTEPVRFNSKLTSALEDHEKHIVSK
jgi:uncharacterized protein (DUF1778 family)